MTIFKYPLTEVYTEHLMPQGAKCILIAQQAHTDAWRDIHLWFEVDETKPAELRKFVVHGTGHKITDGAKHLGSLIDGLYVWHVYDVS